MVGSDRLNPLPYAMCKGGGGSQSPNFGFSIFETMSSQSQNLQCASQTLPSLACGPPNPCSSIRGPRYLNLKAPQSAS